MNTFASNQTDQRTRTKQLKKISFLVLGVSLMMGGLAPVANAGGSRGHHHDNTCETQQRYAGKLTIDGYTTRVRSDRPILRQICSAFRKAGYRAWIEDGCIRVDYDCYKPSVRWRAERYSSVLRWHYGELRMSVRKRAGYSWNDRHRPRRSIPTRTYRWGWGYCD